MRMGRKGEQNVFPCRLCQVHRFRPRELHLAGKIVDPSGVLERFQADDALGVEVDFELSGGEEAAAR